MNPFQHISAELRVFGGAQSLAQLPRELQRAGCSRAFVVCGRTVAAGELLAKTHEALGAMSAGVFDRVQAHSPVPSVEQAARALAESGADAVIAIGGGSAVVTARAASILLAEKAYVRELCTRIADDGRLHSPLLKAPKLAQFVVPTAPTTALVKAGSALHDPATGQRLALFDPKTRARAVFVHPQFLHSAPADLVRSASLNALAMAVEGLESESATPLSDASLMHALRLLSAHLPHAEVDPANVDARCQLVMAAILCGQGTDRAGGGILSVLGHAIGPRSKVANGIVNAVLLPHTMRFNARVTGARLGKVSEALGLHVRSGRELEDAGRALDALLSKLAIPRRLMDTGLSREAFSEVVQEALRDWFLQRNPRPVEGEQELLALLESAW